MGWFTTKALFGAVADRDYDAARIALTKGADPNGHHKGWTPLIRACANGDSIMIEILIAAGADPARQNTAGTDAYAFCREQGLEGPREAIDLAMEHCKNTRALGGDPWKKYAL